jgi:hypothetical protein
MKRRINLYLKKRALMLLGAIAWHLDDWVHRQEVKLRAELSVPVPVEPPGPARPQRPTVSCPFPFPADELLRHRIRGRLSRGGEPQRSAKTTFTEWVEEASKPGVAVTVTNHKRRVTSSDFDRRFAL